jgi:putative NIF3 family GTP cyclohydrolase 1 type 2
MKAIDINKHLNSLIENLFEDTVDRVIYGDPDVVVKGIAVCWMPYRNTIERAKALGANVLIVHEPTFYGHWDLYGDLADIPELQAKKELIDESGITIIRCHDVWDAMPGIGIPFAWGRFLGLGEPTKSIRYYNVYPVDPQPALRFAHNIISKTATLGQPVIGFYGDPERIITMVGLGTGCISDPFEIYRLGGDLAISVDDVVRAWIAGAWCEDTGNPLVVVNHAVSEEPGIAALAEYLKKAFPKYSVTHIQQQCSYRPVL